MKPITIPLAMTLLESANPYELERPAYVLWLHILASRSNFIEENRLWTTSEFPLVVPVESGQSFDARCYDEGEDENTEPSLYIDSRIQDPDFVPETDESMSDSFFCDIKKRPQSSTDNLNHMDLAEETSSIPILQKLRPHATQEGDSIIGQDTGAIPPVASKAPGPNPEPKPNTGPRRTRIVDFAVKYLELDKESSTIKVLHFYLQRFKADKSPINVEGKRAPWRSSADDPEKFLNQLDQLLELAYLDFFNKSPYVFKAYPCASFIAIAFAGPYWCFAICRPASPIIFSQVISVESYVHDIALHTIFNAAEANPSDPGSDEAMGELLTQYSRVAFPEVIF